MNKTILAQPNFRRGFLSQMNSWSSGGIEEVCKPTFNLDM